MSKRKILSFPKLNQVDEYAFSPTLTTLYAYTNVPKMYPHFANNS